MRKSKWGFGFVGWAVLFGTHAAVLAACSSVVEDRGASTDQPGPPNPSDPSASPSGSAPKGDTDLPVPAPGPNTADAGSPDAGLCALPPRDCTLGATACAEIVPFEPVKGPGYENYPLNGETAANQYRSFARRDLVMLVKWVTAFVACNARPGTGNGAVLGLGDMSEANGAIPGTSRGSPGHPAGTHTNGFDMDIAYYQLRGTDNYLRPICPYMQNGQDAYHCVAPPDNLDVARTALALGAFFESSRVRVIGVDGQVGTAVTAALVPYCNSGVLSAGACTRAKQGITFEVTDQGRGWFQFHHHHFHVSLKPVAAGPGFAPFAPMPAEGPSDALRALQSASVPGEAFLLDAR